ncbi:MAG: BRCT domain-containing protein, partial [Desulfocucumaceae bacterium]
IPEVGEIVAASIVTFFGDPRIKESIEKLLRAGVEPVYSKKDVAGSPFYNKQVVVTGSLQKYGRADIEKLLADLGANVSGSVSRKTDYLIIGESPGSKLDKARAVLAS